MKASPRPGSADGDALLRALFLAHPDAMLVVGPDGVIMRANPAAARLLGYALDELVGMPVDTLVPHSSRPRHAGHRAAYALQSQPRPMGLQKELAALRKDGIEVAVEIALSPLRSSRKTIAASACNASAAIAGP